MSARRTRLAVRFYPAEWRARYGEELESLIEESCGGDVSWRMWFDVARAGVCERLHATCNVAGDVSPGERSRSGALLVLSAWVMITVAGLVVQKTSEQWQTATGGSTVFDVVKLAAALGSAMILAGIAEVSAGAEPRGSARASRWGRIGGRRLGNHDLALRAADAGRLFVDSVLRAFGGVSASRGYRERGKSDTPEASTVGASTRCGPSRCWLFRRWGRGVSRGCGRGGVGGRGC